MDYQEPTFDFVAAEAKISDDMLAVNAAHAVLGTDGVSKLSGGIGNQLSRALLRKDQLSKGIKIDQNEEGIKVDVYITVEYGVRIPDCAWRLQRNVKQKLETLAERKVTAVNVHVQGVNNEKK